MRKIIAIDFLSLDGFVAGTNGETDWFVWDEEMNSYYKEFQTSIDTILFGQATYETMANYWATPKADAEDPALTDFMNQTRKIVFSKSLEKAEWNNSELKSEFVPREFAEMKRQSGKDIAIYGSGSIVSQFAKARLLDEYRLIVNPIALGSGIALFQNIEDRLKLKLLNTKTFKCGNVLLCYEPES